MSTALVMLLLMWGQAPARHPYRRVPPAAAHSRRDDYVVGPQDVLNLTVFNDDTLSRPALVVDTRRHDRLPLRRPPERQRHGDAADRGDAAAAARAAARRPGQGRRRLSDEPEHQCHGQGFPQPARERHGRGEDSRYVELKGDPTLTRALSQAGYPTPESGSYVQITHEDRRQARPRTGRPCAGERFRGRKSRTAAPAGFGFVPATRCSCRTPTSSSSAAR